MASIIITESDNTASSSVLTESDVVYVPGFVTQVTGKYTPASVIAKNVPTYIDNIETFVACCGSEPAYFGEAQAYPENFSANARPTGNMFASGDPDPAYIYARELVNAGIPVVYERLNATDALPTVTSFYSEVTTSGFWTKLEDKVEYQIKYLTTGGYPNFEYGASSSTTGSIISAAMISCAENRGDCIALIDHTNKSERSMIATANTSVYYAVSNAQSGTQISSSYAAMYTPWATYSCPATSTVTSFPGSYAYLMSLAQSIQDSNPNWVAVSGVKRGLVPNFGTPLTYTPLTKSIADSYQPSSGTCINAICNIKPYGYCIWGNRTLATVGLEGATASCFTNIRNVVSDIKKVAYTTCLRYMFESNNDVLKMNFKSSIAPTLDNMVQGGGIAGYSIKFLATSEKQKLSAQIVVKPVYATEDFNISISLTDEDVEVA